MICAHTWFGSVRFGFFAGLSAVGLRTTRPLAQDRSLIRPFHLIAPFLVRSLAAFASRDHLEDYSRSSRAEI